MFNPQRTHPVNPHWYSTPTTDRLDMERVDERGAPLSLTQAVTRRGQQVLPN